MSFTERTEMPLLSTEEVCLIIKACGESQVSKLKFRDLQLWFGTNSKSDGSLVAGSSPTPDTEISEIQTQVSKAAFEQEELDTRDEQVKQMLIEDPYEAEKLLIHGELTEDGSDEIESEEA
jgi:hypothetical protein